MLSMLNEVFQNVFSTNFSLLGTRSADGEGASASHPASKANTKPPARMDHASASA